MRTVRVTRKRVITDYIDVETDETNTAIIAGIAQGMKSWHDVREECHYMVQFDEDHVVQFLRHE